MWVILTYTWMTAMIFKLEGSWIFWSQSYIPPPLADIIKRYNLEYHFYADDTQLYVAFKTDCLDKMVECKTTIEQCVRDIDNWMVINKLKVNQDKTEVVLISSRYRPRPPLRISSNWQCDSCTIIFSS